MVWNYLLKPLSTIQMFSNQPYFAAYVCCLLFLQGFFSFKIILLFNIIDFFFKIKTFNDKNNEHVCIGSQVCNFAFKVNLSRWVKEKMLIKAKAWVHASLGSVQKMQTQPINFRVYQIFLGYLIRIVFIILFDQIKNEIQFLFAKFYNQSEIFDRTPDNSIYSIQL